MGHEHAHSHDNQGHNHGRAFAIGVVLNVGFVVVETAYGLKADSLALLSDAGHNLSDVLALLLAWGASALAARKPSARFTYGLRSSTILAALLNAAILLLVVGGIGWEAIQRVQHPLPVEGAVIVGVALAGVVINGATAMLFMTGRHHDLNLRSAFAHMAADAAISLGVAVAGIAVLYSGWLWLDPAVSLVLVVVILFGTWGLLRDATVLALHAVPEDIDAQAVRAYLTAQPGVAGVHDLHIWGMSTTESALTVHLVTPAGHPGDAFIARVARELRERFRISHPTIQVETGDPSHPCVLAPDHVV
jgi:cobalt-zinc-cadmium efflux system protein